MDALLYLMPVTLLLSGISIIAFFWNFKSKQYDDLDSAGSRILFDDSKPK